MLYVLAEMLKGNMNTKQSRLCQRVPFREGVPFHQGAIILSLVRVFRRVRMHAHHLNAYLHAWEHAIVNKLIYNIYHFTRR